jgi:hypothetical protein
MQSQSSNSEGRGRNLNSPTSEETTPLQVHQNTATEIPQLRTDILDER